MITLAIDSTMNGCSAALYHSEKGQIAKKILEMARGQAEHLMPMVDSLLRDAGVKYNDLNKIAVTKGPGAFTGMRIGLAAAKSLSIALGIPIVGVCTFRAVLQTYLNDEPSSGHGFYGVLLETKRQDYYFQMFDGKTLTPCTDKICASHDDILGLINGRKCAILGDASQRFESDVSLVGGSKIIYYDINIPCPSMVAECAVKYKDDQDCNPVYLRSPEIGIPKNPPRKIKG